VAHGGERRSEIFEAESISIKVAPFKLTCRAVPDLSFSVASKAGRDQINDSCAMAMNGTAPAYCTARAKNFR